MKVLCAALLLFSLAAPRVHAQEAPFSAERVAALLEARGLLRNGVSNLHAEGDSLWVGPFLNLTTDGGNTWQVADADSLLDSRNRVFSLDVEGDVLWVGLGYTSTAEGTDGVASAGGFLFSDDGGRTFTYRGPQLDQPGDDTIHYGVSTLEALPIIVPQQSPPFDIDYDAGRGVVWVAGWASGIRRSDDQGRTWQRVVLPPDNKDFVTPDSTYDFIVAPNRGPGNGNFNHMGFGVLVDEEGVIWAGTPHGVNRSADGLTWQHFGADGTPNGLTGSWVVSIEEQPLPGRNPIWMATWNAAEAGEQQRFGVTVTRDGGETFEQVLVGEQVIDFAFRGQTVYVAGRQSGLFISDDGGLTWRTITDFNVRDRPARRVRPGVDVLAVATTRDALWVGTADGLLRTTNPDVEAGSTWQLFRTEVPLHPNEPSAAAPDVETYAYPNPFSPPSDRFVRIRYGVTGGRSSQVRIFDFGMRLVRTLHDSCDPAGGRGARDECEAAWDGTDDHGLRVANGVYFYAVDNGTGTAWGKIQVLE